MGIVIQLRINHNNEKILRTTCTVCAAVQPSALPDKQIHVVCVCVRGGGGDEVEIEAFLLLVYTLSAK